LGRVLEKEKSFRGKVEKKKEKFFFV